MKLVEVIYVERRESPRLNPPSHFYELHDQTYILCNTANERKGSTISKGELMHQDREGRARVSGKSVPGTTLMVFRRPALPGPLPITKSPLRGLIGQARKHLKEI